MTIIATIECKEINLTQTILDTPVTRKALKQLGIKDIPYNVNLPRKEYETFLQKWSSVTKNISPPLKPTISNDGDAQILKDLDDLFNS